MGLFYFGVYMKQYLDIAEKCLAGTRKSNRTGIDTVGYMGDMAKYDLGEGFPAVTSKKLAYRQIIAEMLGFIRGYTNAADFRKLGCKVWDANANENKDWLNNPYRKGKDDLGAIYGAQARDFNGEDQLLSVYENLRKGIDTRREIVIHWNPAELDQMALPPCHLLYQFGIDGEYLNMSLYQRSVDVPLGLPYNIAGYAWLLSVMAQITGHKAGTLTHFMHDIHVYENQIEQLQVQLSRSTHPLPQLIINKDIKTLSDLETWVTPDDFTLANYVHEPALSYPFAV